MKKEKVRILRDQSTRQLAEHLEKRMKEYREMLEDPAIDEKHLLAVSTRGRLNELKELFDLFELPTA